MNAKYLILVLVMFAITGIVAAEDLNAVMPRDYVIGDNGSVVRVSAPFVAPSPIIIQYSNYPFLPILVPAPFAQSPEGIAAYLSQEK